LITVFFIKIVFTVRNSVTALLKRNTLSIRTTKFSWQTLKVNQNSYTWNKYSGVCLLWSALC
jgi:hypothetical protein